ncbi:F-box domain containing protein [Trema orientale]|uniref:F-box domain containing protein n=1 Tax=Trema orientale TaxID=63057 RepID=A0A2P5B4M7_TREOI|nr:F-box domain containing protein [Trema orientale]
MTLWIQRWCDLPEEVWTEIFSWVPPDSLIRSKCVSKSWYSLINSLIKSPDFVNKHLRNIDKNVLSSTSTCLVFCCVSFACGWQDLYKSVTVLHDHHNSKGNRREEHNCEDFRLPNLSGKLNLALANRSHCDGIICLANYKTLVLCNPAINESRILPKPCIERRGFVSLGVVLGYDSRANDYKVVRFGHNRLIRDQSESFKIRAEVYSLRSDSWKEIRVQLELDCYPHAGKGIFCKGAFYWHLQTHNTIVSFNMFDEVFRSALLPNNLLVERRDHLIQLTVWNESVALFIFPQIEAVTKCIEVWVTDGPCSWIKKLTIRPPVDVAFPVAFLKNDEVLMKANRRRFVLYNIHSQMLSEFTFAENTAPDWDFSYVRSLVSVQGGNQSRS